jgi:hypothetical protein
LIELIGLIKLIKLIELIRLTGSNGLIELSALIITPATKHVIPAAAERRAGIHKRHCNYWIPAFAGMTR